MNKQILSIIKKYEGKKGSAIPILQDVQGIAGYISKDSIRFISEHTGIPSAELYGIVTFYSMFRLEPQGRHLIRICKGTACHVSGADNLGSMLKTILKLKGDQTTTEDGRFTLIEVACLGCCSLAPVIMVNEDTYGKLSSDKLEKILNKYE
ncbi:MAG: NADH-quinone oxidoreductase subunit NuoE [Candidatus Marinimicrobia bacterium]|nr:NADH-quinone oxidoreductase subunit NuoE [Candidatus Neomarinimicrobiota bacterium]